MNSKNPKKFWSDFEKHFWEKKPTIIKGTTSLPIPQISEEQLFGVVTRSMKKLRESNYKETPKIRLYLNQNYVDISPDFEALLPWPQDGSFLGYHDRCKSNKGVEEYGVVINNFHDTEPELWEYMCREFNSFFNCFGLPKAFLETFMFIGNYGKTPFGVHDDRSGTFHFPVVGTKKMRLWRPEYVEKHPDIKRTLDYKKHVKNSQLLKGKPGEALYWPSNRWHIAESSGEFVVTWGFSYFFGNVGDNYLNKEIMKQIDSCLQPLTKNETVPFVGGDLSLTLGQNILNRELEVYKETVNSEKLERAVSEKWLNHISSFGFRKVPPVNVEATVTLEDTVEVSPTFPILWVMRPNGDCIVSCRGTSFCFPKGMWIPMLLQLLNTGQNFSIRELTGRLSNRGVSQKKVMSVLRSIQTIGGFQTRKTGLLLVAA